MQCTWMICFFILCRRSLSQASCDWVNKIKTKVFSKVEGEGLHRMFFTSSRLDSVNRFSECRLLYEVEIPAGTYINLNSGNASLADHSIVTLHTFNPEATVTQSSSHRILIVANAPLRKKFILLDTWKLPFMLRYHPAASNQSRNEAVIPLPVPNVFLDCYGDYEQFHLITCSGKRNFSNYNVESLSPSWIAVGPLEKRVVFVHLPTGNKRLVVPIAVGTIVVISASLTRIIHAAFVSL